MKVRRRQRHNRVLCAGFFISYLTVHIVNGVSSRRSYHVVFQAHKRRPLR